IFAPSVIMKEFHVQYRRCATYMTYTLQGVDDPSIKKQNVQILLIRLIFLWFLQLTGSLDRDPQYLLTKFQKRRGRSFYRDFLQPLFQGLGTPRAQRTPQTHQLLGEVPYLGTGLFLPTMEEEEQFVQSLDWPDEVFYQPLEYSLFPKTVNIPFLNLLKSYNWTLDELSTDTSKINPKILGYVFEQSIHTKSLGVVYTPDSVSSQMCKTVLAQAITNEIQTTTLSNNITTFRDLITITDPELQKIILNKLKSLKILDPACGTGHFLVTMLFHLEQIYLAFQSNPSLTIESKNCIREFIISNNLFGVDILPRAIEVTKLRLFLALAELYEDNQSIQPLNVINFHLRTGNSVVGFYRQTEGHLFDFWDDPVRELLDEREDLIGQYMLTNGRSANKRMEIKNKTEYLQLIFSKKLLQVLDIQNITIDQFNKEITPFHWIMEFSDILAQGGFDIVIGNPPYVRADSLDIKLQQYRKFTEKLFDTLIEKWDLYVAFIELGFWLLKPQGILTYIVSDAFCTAKYAKKSRDLLLKSGFLYQIDFFPDIILFEEVGVNSIILHYQKGQNIQNLPTKRAIHKTMDEIERIESLNPAEIGELIFRQDLNLDLLKLNAIKLKLGEICFISKGMVLNSDEKKYKSEFKKEDLISSLKNEIHSKEYITGSFIHPYYLSEIKYLEWNTDRVPHKISRPTFPELYIYPKLLVSRIGCKAVYDEKGILTDDNVNIIVPRHYLRNIENRVLKRREERNLIRNFADKSTRFDLRFICAIINSRLGQNYLNAVRQHRMKNYIYPNELKRLPIPDISLEDQRMIVDLVIEIEDLTNAENFSKKKTLIKELRDKVDSKIELIYTSYLRKIQEKNHRS
ncbi:MAG: Eco57I restriction-modification methylase domain-containing protein, partial [Candidatus Hermodarchaeota archaeon]